MKAILTNGIVSLIVLGIGTANLYAADGYGDVTGQFVLMDDVPEPEIAVEKGDPAVRDSAVCAAETLYKNDLVIDPDTKGIQHIFVYMRRASDIHPDLEQPSDAEVVFDQKNCRFMPHTLLVRTGQSVTVKSDDPVAHNTHTYPILGQAVNFLLAPNDREGVPVPCTIPEPLPIQVKCDIHPWMQAYWLVLSHPYMAVTDSEGKFKIEKLPAGEHEFIVWHERVGYIDRRFNVTIEADQTTELEAVEVPLEQFEK